MIHFLEDEILNLANIAVKNKLFIQGFSLRESLRCFIYQHQIRKSAYKNYKIKILADDNVPFGIAVFDPTDLYTLQTFIKPAYRRQGHGKTLVSEIMKEIPHEEIKVGKGIKGSLLFWDKMVKEECLGKWVGDLKEEKYLIEKKNKTKLKCA